jgi:hypothetical protein
MRQARPGYWSWSAEWWPPDWCSSARLAALLGWSRCCVGLCRSPPPCPPGHPGDSSWMSCARTPCGSPRPVGRCCSRCGPARTAGSSRCATAAPASPTTSWSRSSGARFTSATAACEGHQRARAGPPRAAGATARRHDRSRPRSRGRSPVRRHPSVRRPCPCRKCHPGRSGGMLVLVEDAGEAVASADV